MKNIFQNVFALAMASIALAGCTNRGFLNEGATRVRVSVSDAFSTSHFHSIYFKSSELKSDINIIKTGEHFSISLLSAHICGFREARGLDVFTLDNSNPFLSIDGEETACCTYGGLIRPKSKDRTTRGEISIVANAGESSASKGNVINPDKSNSKGRVIYYNDDVRESGQLINAINLPIYGPREYSGKNVFFDIWMLELDNQENKRLKSILGSLADLGSKSYPPSAPILGVLNMLGEAFLSGNQDDIEAHFQMRFDVPAPDNSTVSRLPLAEGYYAFIREENRDLDPQWKKVAMNESEGVLCKSETGEYCVEGDQNTYRDRSWFLVRIAKETSESALDIEYGEQLSKFMEKIDQIESADIEKTREAIGKLSENLVDLVCDKTSDSKKEKLEIPCPKP